MIIGFTHICNTDINLLSYSKEPGACRSTLQKRLHQCYTLSFRRQFNSNVSYMYYNLCALWCVLNRIVPLDFNSIGDLLDCTLLEACSHHNYLGSEPFSYCVIKTWIISIGHPGFKKREPCTSQVEWLCFTSIMFQSLEISSTFLFWP